MDDFSYIDDAATDEEWTEAYRARTDDEQIAYIRNYIEELRNDPKGVTPEEIEGLEALALDYEKAVERERIALRDEAIAKAELDRAADNLLAAMPDSKHGN